MEQALEQLMKWARQGREMALPDWGELPAIPLYMDQVIFYLGESLAFFEGEQKGSLLTSSMINNYVKNGVLPHPEKKKYRREHLASLAAVCLLKQVLSLPEIKTLLGEGALSPELYGLFRQAHGNAVRETCRDLEESCRAGEDPKALALRLAAQANAQQAAAQRILEELAKGEERESKKS